MAKGVYSVGTPMGQYQMALDQYQDVRQYGADAGPRRIRAAVEGISSAFHEANNDQNLEARGKLLFNAATALVAPERLLARSSLMRSGALEGIADNVAARYGSGAQRQALLNQVSGAQSLSEAKGVVYASREMRRLGYALKDVSLQYRGHQGVDLVFSRDGQYAIVEAKHSQHLSSLQTYAGGLRQGSADYNISRLERYFSTAMARTMHLRINFWMPLLVGN